MDVAEVLVQLGIAPIKELGALIPERGAAHVVLPIAGVTDDLEDFGAEMRRCFLREGLGEILRAGEVSFLDLSDGIAIHIVRRSSGGLRCLGSTEAAGEEQEGDGDDVQLCQSLAHERSEGTLHLTTLIGLKTGSVSGGEIRGLIAIEDGFERAFFNGRSALCGLDELRGTTEELLVAGTAAEGVIFIQSDFEKPAFLSKLKELFLSEHSSPVGYSCFLGLASILNTFSYNETSVTNFKEKLLGIDKIQILGETVTFINREAQLSLATRQIKNGTSIPY